MRREHFAPAVEAASSLSANDLAALVGADKESALSLILLLDQIPRNIYRGAEAKKAYTITDPKARELCKTFISPEKAFDRLDQWPNYWYPSFFYMPRERSLPQSFPLAHSILKSMPRLSQSCTQKISKITGSSRSGLPRRCQQASRLLSKRPSPRTGNLTRRMVRTVVLRARLREMSELTKGCSFNAAAVLERFGRYPSRNEAVGRESTTEEREFLKDGPGWGAK